MRSAYIAIHDTTTKGHCGRFCCSSGSSSSCSHIIKSETSIPEKIKSNIEKKMATNTTLSAEYLAESKTQLVTTMYAVPIALETVSTTWRLWAAATAQSGFAYADYLMLFATVCYFDKGRELVGTIRGC